MISERLRQTTWERPSFILAALLPSIVVPHLLDLGYWRTDFEVAILGLGSAAVGLAFHVVEYRWPRVANVLISVAIYWFFDVYFDDRGYAAAFLLLASLIVLKSRHREDACRVVLFFSCIWLLVNLAQSDRPMLEAKASDQPRPPLSRDLPPLVHIVLDEQMSPAALPETVPPYSAAEAILDDYVGRGFTIFSLATSTSPATELALGRLVELSAGPDISARRKPKNELVSSKKLGAVHVTENRYFDRLHELGYAITTYQTAYLDLCSGGLAPGDECFTYHHYGHGHSMSALMHTRAEKVKLALDLLDYEYQRAGYIGRSVVLYSMWKHLFAGYSIEGSRARIVMALAIAELLDERLRDLEPGRAYFAHLLLPHSPYVLDERCTIKNVHEWLTTEIPWRREAAYGAYWEQASCTHKLIMNMIDNARSRSATELPIFVVHGDHGSRITYFDPSTRHSPDMRDMLTTFLAVKAPGLKPGKEGGPVELQATFAKLMNEWLDTMRR